MKKRSCRRTEEEIRIHEQAVKLRKMTDEQLVSYAERSSGQKESSKGITEFLEELKTSKIPGIGIVTINKLLKMAVEHGYIQ